MLEVNIGNLADAMMPFVERDIPILIEGETGIGKTYIARNVIKPALEAYSGLPVDYHDIRVSGLLPEDFTGIPDKINDPITGDPIVRWARSAVNPVDNGKMHLIALEEITHNRALFAPLYRFVAEREDAAGYKLPKHHRIIAACNPRSDQSGDAKLFKALERRFAHIRVRTSNLDTVNFGKENGWDARLLAFLKKYPELNHKMSDEDPAWPTPSRWEQVNKFMNLSISQIENAAAAIVGKGVAMKFAAEIEAMVSNIPRLADVAANPMTATVPDDDQHQLIIARMLSRAISVNNAAAFIAYLRRLSPDIASLVAGDIVSDMKQPYLVTDMAKTLIS